MHAGAHDFRLNLLEALFQFLLIALAEEAVGHGVEDVVFLQDLLSQ